MTYTARELISRAYNLSQIVRKPYQSPSETQIGEGLFLLNELLAVKSVSKSDIPYYDYITLNPVPGQEKYFIEHLCSVQSATFNIGTIRISMKYQGRSEYFGTSRVDGISSYPLTYHVERTFNGSNFYVYFLPQAIYPIKINGKFGFDKIESLDLDLESSYENAYLAYLRVGLAKLICLEYAMPIPDDLKALINSYDELYRDIAPFDFTRKTIVPIGHHYIDNLTEGLINQRFGPYRP